MNSRDRSILQHIIGYCRQIQNAVERFGNQYAIFAEDQDYIILLPSVFYRLGN